MDVIADSAACHQDDAGAQRSQPVSEAPAPVSAVRLSARRVLLTYFDGDVGSNVDEHFSRSLKTSAAAAARQDDNERHCGLPQQLCRRAASKYRADCTISDFVVVGTRKQLPPSIEDRSQTDLPRHRSC